VLVEVENGRENPVQTHRLAVLPWAGGKEEGGRGRMMMMGSSSSSSGHGGGGGGGSDPVSKLLSLWDICWCQK